MVVYSREVLYVYPTRGGGMLCGILRNAFGTGRNAAELHGGVRVGLLVLAALYGHAAGAEHKAASTQELDAAALVPHQWLQDVNMVTCQ